VIVLLSTLWDPLHGLVIATQNEVGAVIGSVITEGPLRLSGLLRFPVTPLNHR
jgi:hypothetical protein